MRSFYGRGVLFAIIGVLILSPDSLVIRLIQSDNAAIIAGRALFATAALALLAALNPRYRRGMRWRPLLLYSVFFGIGLAIFPLSIKLTYTANTLVILAAMPIFAAIGARIFLRESTAPMVWITALVIFFGIALLFSGSAGAGDLLGNLLALATAMSVAAATLVIRRYRNLAVAPGMALGGLWCFLAFAPFADWGGVSGQDVALLAVDGVIIIALSFLFITRAARYIPPAEVNLFFLLETLFGPFWVWWALNETPPPETLWAGVLIVSMLGLYGAWTYKKTRR